MGYGFGISRSTVSYHTHAMAEFFADVLGCSVGDLGSQIVDSVYLVNRSLVPTFRWLSSCLSSETR